MKTIMKAPGTGTKHLKLKYDQLLSTFAFNFNLRRFTQGVGAPADPHDPTYVYDPTYVPLTVSPPTVEARPVLADAEGDDIVARMRAHSGDAAVQQQACHALHQMTANNAETRTRAGAAVGWCRLTVSKPVLKAPGTGTKHLKLKYDQLLSTFAFNFNLRRYTVVAQGPKAESCVDDVAGIVCQALPPR